MHKQFSKNKLQESAAERWYKEKGRDYFRIYKKLDYYLGEALSEYPQNFFTLDEIQDLLFEETGFKFKKPTLRKYVAKMKEKYGQSPLSNFYKLNLDYYKNRKIKPPRIKPKL